MHLFLCVPVWLGLWPRSDVGVRICHCLFLKAGLQKSLASVWKSQLENLVDVGCFFSSLLFFYSGSYRNSLSGEAFMPLELSYICSTGHGTGVCSLHGLCRQPFTCKGSTSDFVALITKNLKYCRCGMPNLPGPLSHIPKSRQPACSSVTQGRRVLCAFLQVGSDSGT